MWFEPVVCLETNEDVVTLGVPNEFASIWINDNYLDLITQRLRLIAGRLVHVKLTTTGTTPSATSQRAGADSALARSRASAGATRKTTRYDERGPAAGLLNPRNTFETFVVGSNSQMAHAAALAVAQSPAQAYNPLFLYGDTGLGKTHLMHAIGHAILRRKPDARVAYLSTEKFTNEFIQALQENSLTKFRQRYRQADVLLLDDVQFLANKERIQEEFFHTFNDLFEAGKQIVLSSDRRASEIQKLEARLVSRFEWGLPADIQSPDVETRIAILRTKAAVLKCDLPAPIINFIAQNITKNIRRLEGALIKVASYTALTSKPIDLATAERLLHDVLMEQAQTILTIETIQKRVADHFQIRHSDMTSKRRPNNIAIPRQIAMYITRTLTKHSLQEIGDAFGGRDHGTVIHACKAVDNMMEQDATTRSSVEFLKNQLGR
jgi:chromosomal replication initiator protein